MIKEENKKKKEKIGNALKDLVPSEFFSKKK
jgi:hypothetical protein